MFERTAATRVHDGTLLRSVVSVVLAIVLLSTAIHIVAVLLVPRFASSDGWTRISEFAEVGRFRTMPTDGVSPVLPGLDPLFVHSACFLPVEDAPGVLSLTAPDRFWSLALYNDEGIATFSLNDRTAQDGTLDMLIVNPVQSAQLKENPPDDIDEIIVVETQSDSLVAVFRLYAPTAELRRSAQEAIDAAVCDSDL
jgi:uncharacterized membrane protein